jgi:hypothetical protein
MQIDRLARTSLHTTLVMVTLGGSVMTPILLVVLGYDNLILPSLILLAPVISALILLVATTEKGRFAGYRPLRFPPLVGAFVLVYLAAVIALLALPGRSILYFIAVCASMAMILLQVVLSEGATRSAFRLLVLCEIALVTVSISWSLISEHPYYFAGTDTFWHERDTELTIATEHVITDEMDSSYSRFPGYHVMAAALTLVSGFDVLTSLFMVNSAVCILLLLVTYNIARRLLRSPRTALLSALILSMMPTFIYYSSYPVPRLCAFVLGLVFIYLVLDREGSPLPALKNSAIMTVIIASAVMMHSATIVQVTLIMVGFLIVGRLVPNGRILRTMPVVLLVLIAASYWLFAATSFSETILQYLFKSREGEVIPASISAPTDMSQYVAGHIVTMVLLFFAVLGLGSAGASSRKLTTLSVMTVALLILYLPSPLKQSDLLASELGFYRFQLFAEPFIAVVVSAGMCYLVQFHRRTDTSLRRSARIGALLLLVLVASFNSYTSPSNASDFNEDEPSKYFTYSDIMALAFVEESLGTNATVYSDYFITRYLSTMRWFPGIEDLDTNYLRARIIASSDTLANTTDVSIVRLGEFEDRGALLFGSTSSTFSFEDNPANSIRLSEIICERNSIFSDGRIILISG